MEFCKATLRRKIELISFSMDEINGSMENETKSSAGDKHETARSRMQTEFEKLQWQLEEIKSQFEFLQKVDLKRSTDIISSQNLVVTNLAIFFITVPLGKLELKGKSVYVISHNSPIAKKLIGLKVNDNLTVNAITYEILEIW